jgi:hypothetical protein
MGSSVTIIWDMPTAADEFTVSMIVDGRRADEPEGLSPQVVGQGAMRAVFNVLTDGLVAAEPFCEVVVLDRASGTVVIRHHWGQNPQAAQYDLDSVTAAMTTMSVDQFCEEDGIAR